MSRRENGMAIGDRMGDTLRDQALIAALTGIISRAAAAILKARAGALATRHKADLSPVTAADEASEAVILEGLALVLPGLAGYLFFPVDPLDGTRELVAGRDEFCVNIALVSDGRARLGLIGSPPLGLLWCPRTPGDGRAGQAAAGGATR